MEAQEEVQQFGVSYKEIKDSELFGNSCDEETGDYELFKKAYPYEDFSQLPEHIKESVIRDLKWGYGPGIE